MSTEHDTKTHQYAIQRALMLLANVVERHPIKVVVLGTLLAALSIGLACTRLTFLTQRNDLVSPNKPNQKRWQQYIDEFGDDEDMVVVVEGHDPVQMMLAIDTLAEKVKQHPEQFDRVFYKVDLAALRDRALLYLPTQKIQDIQNNLKNMQMLLDPPQIPGLDPLFTWRSLTLQSLLGEADRRANSLLRDTKFSDDDEQFFQELISVARFAAATVHNPADYQSPWQSMLPVSANPDPMSQPQYFFSDDKTLAFLLVRPKVNTSSSSFTSAQGNIDTMRAILAETEGQFSSLTFGLTGLPVLENDEMMASQMDTATASWLALIGVSILYLLVYRGIRYPLLTVSTLIVGTIWALGWLTLTVGHLNILSATFAVMLIGLGDYGVLWVTRYEQERRLGLAVNDAITTTTTQVGPSILTAAATTALAFYSAMLADFHAVSELGWIAGSGVLLCALSCFTMLPAMVRLLDRKDKDEAERMIIPLCPQTPAAWLPSLNRYPRWVLAGAVVLTVVCGTYAARVRFDHNLLKLQAHDLDSVQWELKLIDHTAGASWHALSYTATPEEALALKERFEKLPEVSRVVEVASLVPREQETKLAYLKDIHHRLRRLPKKGAVIPHARPSAKLLQGQLTQLQGRLQKLCKEHATIQTLATAVHQLEQAMQQTDQTVAEQRLQQFEEFMTRDLASDLHRLRAVSTPITISVADLPQSLRERYLSPNGKWLLRIFATQSLWEFAPLQQFVNAVTSVDPEATGKPFTTLEGLAALRNGYQWAGGYALIAMIVVLLLDFRNPWHTLLALAPLLVGVIVSLGIMGMLGLSLNPANMIAFPLILGVGADNGVHIVHDYLSNRKRQPYSLSLCTGRGIMVAALTTILGFGTLMLSHHRGLAGLGTLLAIGVACCMVTALVILPSLLRLFTSHDSAKSQQWPTPKSKKSAA